MSSGQAIVNPNAFQQAQRDVARIATLRAAIPKAEAKGQTDRVASLNSELDRRLANVAAVREELAKVDV